MEFSKDTFELIFNSAPDATIVANKEGRIVASNNRIKTLFGYTPTEMKGLTIEDLLPSTFRENHLQHRSNFDKTPVTREMGAVKELLAKRKDGTEFYVEISLSPIHIDNEVFVSASIRDVSEKILLNNKIRETLNALENKNKELEQFAFIVSHDLQEPLRTIISLTELIKEDCKEKMDEKAQLYITSIFQSSNRMIKLVEELLEFSRMGNDKELRKVDTKVLFDEIVADLGSVIKENNVVVCAENLPIVKGHSTQLRMLFQNLMGNAIKFRMREISPKIKISAQKKDSHWLFSFSDNGIGISKENLEKIFVIFKRLHSRTEYEGTGIGLAHCKKIVESHRGKIWVDSILGQGSTFNFTLPL